MPIAYIFLSDSFNYYKSYTYDKCLGIMETSFVSCSLYPPVFLCVYSVYTHLTGQDVWAPGRLGAGACASEIHGVYDSHQTYMLLEEHIIFINPTSILSSIIFIQRKSTY